VYRSAPRQCIHDEQHDQSAVGPFSKVLGQRAVLHRTEAQVKVLALAFVLALSGCAVMPNDISPEIVHMSHVVQHFGATPTNFGVNIAQLTARWNLQHNFHIEASEGIALDRHYSYGDMQGCGELQGPREEFTAKIGYTFHVH
jgi:hypothetical protein